MKKIVSYFLLCFSFSGLFSQNNQVKFQIIYNYATSNNGFLIGSAAKNSLSGYMTAGWVFGGSTLFPAGIIIETDTMGNALWARRYKGDNLFGTTPLMFNDFVKSGANYFLTGQRNSGAMLMKINSNGSTINFSNTYSGNAGWGNRLRVDGSNNIIVAGGSEFKSINPDKDSTCIYIFKTNNSGTFQWGRSYTLTSPVFDSHDQAMDVAVTPTGYAFTGYHSEKNGVDTTTNIFLFTTDFNGTLQWFKSYGAIGNNEQGNALYYDAANNQFVIMGFTDAASAFGDICMLRTDASGNLLSSTAYGTNSGIAQAATLVATSDGGFAIMGWAAIVLSNYKPFLVKLNSSFAHQWTKYYNPTISGGFFVGGDEAATHGYLLSTMTADATYGGWATEFIKTDSQGQTTSSCGETNYTPQQRTYTPAVKTIAPTVRNGGSGSSFTAGNSTFTPASTVVCMACAKPSATINSTPSSTVCSGTSVTLTANGGGTYSWNTGATTASISVAPTGTTVYNCSVTVASCDSVVPFIVTVASSPTVNISGGTTICSGQNATLTASGGGTYSWSNSSTTASIIVSPTANATYTVVVTGAGGCTSTATANVNVTSVPTATVSGNITICLGDIATLTASGGANYSWSTGATTATITDSPTANATYTVTVSNGNCSSTTTASVTVNSAPSVSISGNTNLCTGNSSTLTASGGTTYSWNTTQTSSSIVVSPVINSTYTVIAANASGCTGTATVAVNVSPPPVASVSGNNTICSGQSASLTASGGLTYSWTTGATTSSISVSPTANATYSVIVSAGTCSDTAAISVTVNTTPTATITMASTTICSGSSATLTATGGGNYSWNTGSTANQIVVSPTNAATYSVLVSNGTCSDSSSVTISVSPPVTANVSSSSATICAGQSATLNASGGTIYSWNTSATTSSIVVSPSSNSNYTVIVSNGACADTAFASINVNPSPAASISGANNICSGQSATLTAQGGGTYSWNNGSTGNSISVSPSANTSYTVTVTNASGCTATAISTVTVTAVPNATISSNPTICEGSSAVLSASGGTTYSWSTNATTSSILVNPTSSSNYSVVVANGNCTSAASVSVTVNPKPTANAGTDITINYGDNTTLTASGGGNYSWSTGANSQNIIVSPTATTDYCVIVTNASGCTDSACVEVFIEMNCGEIFAPTAFSPNGDMKNDVFLVRGKCIKDMHLVIYDRWGIKVFEYTGPEMNSGQGWNGIYNGTLQNTGVFAYILDYTLVTGKSDKLKGNVTLVK